MFNRCKHSWTEVTRHWNKPYSFEFEAERMTGRMFESILRMRRGWTVIELRCEHCGDIRFIEADGKAT